MENHFDACVDPLYQGMMILMLCKIRVEDETTQVFVLNEVQHILPWTEGERNEICRVHDEYKNGKWCEDHV